MLSKVIYFDFAMILLDFITISELRKFLLDFLRVKKSSNNAERIYAAQSIREKMMLSFIQAHLKNYTKEFSAFHRLYKTVIITLIPQYLILIVCNILLGLKSMYVLCFFAIVKILVCLLVRINVDSNRVSVYRKK